MAAKVERQRGMFEGRQVTILKGKPGTRSGKVTIRDYGFVKEVPAKQVTALKKDEPNSVLRFEPPSD